MSKLSNAKEKRQAHRILSEAAAGADVSRAVITKCLLATGDLAGVRQFVGDEEVNFRSADDLHFRLLTAARRILDANGRDRVSDEFAIGWAEQVLRQNAALEARLHGALS